MHIKPIFRIEAFIIHKWKEQRNWNNKEIVGGLLVGSQKEILDLGKL